MTDLAQNALAAKRVGQYLIDAGVLTAAQLDEALDRQRRMSKAGFHVLLGTILEEMGAIDRQSLEAIILRQRLDEGSVNLGPDVDWSPFRPQEVDAPAPPVPAAVPADVTSALSPQHAAEAIDAFFGQAESVQPTFPSMPAPEWPAPESTPASFMSLDQPNGATSEPAQDAEQAAPTKREETFPRFPFFGRRHSQQQPVEAEQPVPAETEPTPPAESEPSPQFEPVPVSQLQPESESVFSLDVNAPPMFEPAPAWDPTADAASVPWATPQDWEPLQPMPTDEVEFESVPEANQENSEPDPMTATVPFAPHSFTADVDTSETAEATVPSTPESAAESPVGGDSFPMDILGFKLTRSANGLSPSDVTAVVGQLVARTKTLEDQIAEAKDTLSHLDSMRRYGEQSVKAADTIAEQIRQEAEDQATAIRDRAGLEARKIIAEARSRHDEIVRAAGNKAMEVAGEIERELEEHRSLYDAFRTRAEALINTDTTDQD